MTPELYHIFLKTVILFSRPIPMPKKGDLSLATNYRGISLMPIAAKLYNRLILNRLIPFVEPVLRNNQNGFRRGRSTLSQILRRIIRESQLCNLDLALVFVDFQKTLTLLIGQKCLKSSSFMGSLTK